MRIGCVGSGQRSRERIWIVTVRHRLLVIPAGREQLAVVVDALGDGVVDPEWRGVRDPLAILVLLRRQCIAARRAGALDSEQVVVSACQAAVAPAGFVDGLRNRHRGGNAVSVLAGNRSGRDLGDER